MRDEVAAKSDIQLERDRSKSLRRSRSRSNHKLAKPDHRATDMNDIGTIGGTISSYSISTKNAHSVKHQMKERAKQEQSR